MLSNSSSNYSMKIGTMSKAIFLNMIIKESISCSPGQSIQQYEWRLMPTNMNIVLQPMSFPITSSTIMHSSMRATSTNKFSTTSKEITTGTDKAITDKIKKEKQMTDGAIKLIGRGRGKQRKNYEYHGG